MKKEDHFIKQPVYLGGNKAFKEFIYKNLKYPKAALKNKTEGIVMIKYDIDFKGNVVDAKVSKSVGDGCDEEALRLVKLLKFEIPKGPRKLRVLFHKTVKIRFKLPKEKPKPKAPQAQKSMKYNYNIVPSAASKEKTNTIGSPQKQTYNYTISIKKKS